MNFSGWIHCLWDRICDTKQLDTHPTRGSQAANFDFFHIWKTSSRPMASVDTESVVCHHQRNLVYFFPERCREFPWDWGQIWHILLGFPGVLPLGFGNKLSLGFWFNFFFFNVAVGRTLCLTCFQFPSSYKMGESAAIGLLGEGREIPPTRQGPRRYDLCSFVSISWGWEGELRKGNGKVTCSPLLKWTNWLIIWGDAIWRLLNLNEKKSPSFVARNCSFKKWDAMTW